MVVPYSFRCKLVAQFDILGDVQFPEGLEALSYIEGFSGDILEG